MEKIEKIPTHVSMIMDGNGRWANERGKERVFGHMEGAESVRACVKASIEAGVRYLSLFAFSEENWNRPEDEVIKLMDLMMKSMKNEMPELNRQGVRFLVLGNRPRLSDDINAMIDECEKMTAGNEKLTLIILMSYSGKWDILQATRKLALECAGDTEKIVSITMDDISAHLVTAGIPDPDLIVRTSGEYRLSNYLLWQGAYSEWLFVKTLWPDFRREEFFSALEEYSKRDRRYGKVK